jgi:hypothetical protein
MTVKIRLEALPDDVTAALDWLKSTGAALTGLTRLYPNRVNPESHLYGVLMPGAGLCSLYLYLIHYQ